MAYRIALAGNPNSGKTTLFNVLTGSNQYVGNWPGVTVEKKEGRLKGHKQINIIDLPGIYSLSPYSLEEIIARDFLINERPDIIINIIDGTNIERNLYLTLQLIELNIPIILAINMMDIVQKNGNVIDTKSLKEKLGCEIVEISALKEKGVSTLVNKAVSLTQEKPNSSIKLKFTEPIEKLLEKITNEFSHKVDHELSRFYAIKLFEKDEKISKQFQLSKESINELTRIEKQAHDDSASMIANQRYTYITETLKDCFKNAKQTQASNSDKIDKIVTNRWLALPIFALIMIFVYYISVTSIGGIVTDWTNDILFGDVIPPMLTSFLESLNTSPWLISLIVDGIIGGVGAVLGFVPQMFILFAFLGFLEASGYMARVAFIMDRIFHRFGLSGKSFIPMLIGTGCSVPGIMASRTIENENDRRMTILTTSFIPCGAKLPIIALIAGALFNRAWWVGPSAYFIGIAAVIVSGIILKKTKLFIGDSSLFVMELPSYHLPSLKNLANSVWERGSSFIKKAGTIIFISSIFIWFTSNVGISEGKIAFVADLNDGFLAMIGNLFAPLFKPLGWGNWKATVATITGLVAKENVVNTFGILYGIAEVSEDGQEIWSTLASSFSTLSAYSFLVFNLLCAPCFAAIGAIKREMNNAKWTAFAIAYQTVFAYSVSLGIYQLGSFMITGNFNLLTIIALLVLIILLYLLFKKPSTKQSSLLQTS